MKPNMRLLTITSILLVLAISPVKSNAQTCVSAVTNFVDCPADNCTNDQVSTVSSYGVANSGSKDIVEAQQCGSTEVCNSSPGPGAQAAITDTSGSCLGTGDAECDPSDTTSCASGYTCSPITSTCVPNGPSTGSGCAGQGAKCSADSDCCTSLTCQSSQCVSSPPPGSCTTDDDCPGDQICTGQTCVDPPSPPPTPPPCYDQCDSTCINYDPSACGTDPGSGSGSGSGGGSECDDLASARSGFTPAPNVSAPDPGGPSDPAPPCDD